MMLVALVGFAITGCAGYGPESRSTPDSSEDTDVPDRLVYSGLEEAIDTGLVRDAQSIPLERAASLAGFGEGSVWVTDHGDYSCDDTEVNSSGSSGAASSSAVACAAPEKTFLRRLDPQTAEVESTIRIGGSSGLTVAFGAGSVWATVDGYHSSSARGDDAVLRIDPETNKVIDEITISTPSGIAFGEGSVWVSSENHGAVSRIDPGTGEIVEEIKVSSGRANDIAVGNEAVWVASLGATGGVSELSQEEYESGTRQQAQEGAKLVRIDPESEEVVAEIPIEERAIESGASGVTVDGATGTVWATSFNGKLFRVDPANNEIAEEIPLGDYAHEVESFASSVWAVSEVGVRDPVGRATQRLTRVNPESGRLTGAVDTEKAGGLAVGGGRVWLSSSSIETGSGTLTRITP